MELTDRIYSRAIELGFGPSNRPPMADRIATWAYYGAIVLFMTWVASMAFDRALPVEFTSREVVNPGGRVMQGEQLQVRSGRKRRRVCELTRRWTVIDGAGRRHEYDPQHYDAYGPATGSEIETDVNGPTIPLDAVPGQGRWFVTLAWDCNMLQRATGWSIVLVQAPVLFEIVARRP
ncbi:MAG: hypothetical protein WAP03_19295 [Methylorubrum rhodinum]|uniref:hypothetical protein n=1 Tax=Methylorubrum rhodinum TaxID=29428 RepID=UPI003BB04A83